jgi:hypothetical protein
MHNIIERERPLEPTSSTPNYFAQLLHQVAYTDDPESMVELDNLIEEAFEDFKDHIDTCLDYARNLELTIASIDEEIARLKTLKDQRTSRIDRLRSTVKRYCELCNISEVITDLFTIRVKKNPLSVQISDGCQLPEEYLTEKITVTPNKKLIAEHMKAGVVIDGVQLVQNTRLEIK